MQIRLFQHVNIQWTVQEKSHLMPFILVHVLQKVVGWQVAMIPKIRLLTPQTPAIFCREKQKKEKKNYETTHQEKQNYAYHLQRSH